MWTAEKKKFAIPPSTPYLCTVKNWLLTIYQKDNTVSQRLAFHDRTENEAQSEAMSHIESNNIVLDWTLQPIRIITKTIFGFDWFIRVTPTTFELTDADVEQMSHNAPPYFGAEIGEHDLGDPTELEVSEIYESECWKDWYDFEAYPAMFEYAHDKLN